MDVCGYLIHIDANGRRDMWMEVGRRRKILIDAGVRHFQIDSDERPKKHRIPWITKCWSIC